MKRPRYSSILTLYRVPILTIPSAKNGTCGENATHNTPLNPDARKVGAPVSGTFGA